MQIHLLKVNRAEITARLDSETYSFLFTKIENGQIQWHYPVAIPPIVDHVIYLS